jgi:exonuclease SbcC
MIPFVHIKNFQSHADTYLEFHDGLNAIVGPSDSGKTAIIRALNWVVNNRPSGDEFRRWSTKETSVFTMADDLDIGRIRTASRNEYVLGSYIPDSMPGAEDEQEIFKSFGSNVPQQIAEVLNMSELNFQFQMDNYFLLGNSPGEVGRYLNQIIDLDVIDTTLFNISAQLREEKRNLSEEQAKIENLTTSLAKYEWISEAEGILTGLEIEEQKIQSLRGKRDKLESLIGQISHEQNQLEQTEKIFKFSDQLAELEKQDNEIEEMLEFRNDLSDIIGEIEQAQDQLNEFEDVLKFEKELNQLIEQHDEIQKLKLDCDWLKASIESINQATSELKRHQKEEKEAQTEFDRLMPDVCPLCGQEIGTGYIPEKDPFRRNNIDKWTKPSTRKRRTK